MMDEDDPVLVAKARAHYARLLSGHVWRSVGAWQERGQEAKATEGKDSRLGWTCCRLHDGQRKRCSEITWLELLNAHGLALLADYAWPSKVADQSGRAD